MKAYTNILCSIFKGSKCSSSYDLYIGGNAFAQEYNYVSLIIKKWMNQSYCKNTTEIDVAIKNTTVGVGFIEFYFDSSDYSNPIKQYLNTDNDFSLIPSYMKNVNLYFRK